MSPFSYGEINTYIFPIDFHPTTLFFGYFSILAAIEVNKGKTPRSSSLGINHDLYTLNWPVLVENVVEFIFCGVNAEAKDAQAVVGLRIIAGAHMAPATRHRTV